ncbi:hypothetical protein AGMMS4956_05000 [Bacteroidia bacterium]|nr:hypothetical protein AGMMS4956_05000 [Bacteroidia bacterium]
MKNKILFFAIFATVLNVSAQPNAAKKPAAAQKKPLERIETRYGLLGPLFESYTVIKGTPIKEGVYKSYLENGFPYAVYNFQNNLPHGKCEEYTMSPDVAGTVLEFSKTYLNGDLHGEWKEYKYINGKNQVVKQRVYKKGEIESEKEYYAGGKQKTVIVSNGLCQGWYEDGKKAAEYTMKNMKKDGRETYWYPNGQVATITDYKEDKRNGEVLEYHENGQLKIQNRYNKDGEKDGLFLEFNEKGDTSYLETYKDGLQDGRFERYYTNGAVYSTAIYEKGEIVYSVHYSRSGKKAQEVRRQKPNVYLTTDYDTTSNVKIKETGYNKLSNGRTEEWRVATFYPNGKEKRVSGYDNQGNPIEELHNEDGSEKISVGKGAKQINYFFDKDGILTKKSWQKSERNSEILYEMYDRDDNIIQTGIEGKEAYTTFENGVKTGEKTEWGDIFQYYPNGGKKMVYYRDRDNATYFDENGKMIKLVSRVQYKHISAEITLQYRECTEYSAGKETNKYYIDNKTDEIITDENILNKLNGK